MPIPHKPKGYGPIGGTAGHHTKYQHSYMNSLESAFPDWHEDAECSEYDPDLFMISSLDSPDIVALAVDGYIPNDKDVAAANRDKLAEAEAICKSCLVSKECGESATNEDLQWTIRAGKTLSSIRSKGRPRTAVRREKEETPAEVRHREGRPCLRGHVNEWTRDARGFYRCMECDRIRAIARIKGEKIEPVRTLPSSETCVKGHNEWRMMKSGERIRRVCMPCKRERDRLFRKNKSAKLGA